MDHNDTHKYMNNDVAKCSEVHFDEMTRIPLHENSLTKIFLHFFAINFNFRWP